LGIQLDRPLGVVQGAQQLKTVIRAWHTCREEKTTCVSYKLDTLTTPFRGKIWGSMRISIADPWQNTETTSVKSFGMEWIVMKIKFNNKEQDIMNPYGSREHFVNIEMSRKFGRMVNDE